MSALREKMIREMQLRDFSPRTQESYLGAVKGLVAFCSKSPDTLTQKEVEDYLLHLKMEGKSSSTRSVAISALRFFYDQTLKSENVFLEFPKRRIPRILPEILSKSEVSAIIDAAKNIKHRAILMVAYSAGLRLSEIVHLKVEHIDSARMQIRVAQGKGNKDRYTLLSKRLIEELRVYYRAYRPDGLMFFSKKRTIPMCPTTIQRIYKDAKRKAGIGKGRGIHTLRHYAESRTMPS